jgi:hypothetical protein
MVKVKCGAAVTRGGRWHRAQTAREECRHELHLTCWVRHWKLVRTGGSFRSCSVAERLRSNSNDATNRTRCSRRSAAYQYLHRVPPERQQLRRQSGVSEHPGAEAVGRLLPLRPWLLQPQRGQAARPATEAAIAGFGIDTDNYFAKVVSLKAQLAWQVAANADTPVQLERANTELLLHKMLIEQGSGLDDPLLHHRRLGHRVRRCG